MRLRSRSSVTIAAAVSALVVVTTIGVVLLDRRGHLAATNTRVSASLVGLVIPAHHRRCQGGQYVPANASTVRVFVGFERAATGPRLHLDYFAPERGAAPERGPAPEGGPGPERMPAFTAVLPAGYAPGRQTVRLPAHATIGLGLLCIANDGPIPVGLAGNLTSLNPAARTGSLNGPGERTSDEVRTDYFLSGRPSWLELSSTIVSRASMFRPAVESAGTIWAMLALLLIVLVGACVFAVWQLGEIGARAGPQRQQPGPGP